jgi:cytochrome c peroxidase
VNIGPPTVQAQTDVTGAPLAYWDTQKWVPVIRRPQSSLGSVATGTPAGTARHSPGLYNIAYGAVLPPSDNGRTAGVIWSPWDGRYDSHWSLVADVLEFGATQNTDRSHVALRIFQKHRAEYEAMTGAVLPDLNAQDGFGKYVYPRHGSPTLANRCWFDAKNCTDPVALPPSAAVRDQINAMFVNAGKAMSSYMRRLVSNKSAYDRFMAGDVQALSPSAQRGLRLFIGKAECIMCHNGPNFTDSRFHNIGVPSYDLEGRTAGSALITSPDGAQSGCFEGLGPTAFCPDPGRNGWQARAAGQCVMDTAAVGTRAVSCQRVDQPDSLSRYDVAMDCRSAASDVPNKDAQCLPATVFPASKCAYPVADACQNDPLCQWSMPTPLCVQKSNGQPGSACPHTSADACTANAACQWTMPVGRCVAKGLVAELGQFKTPTLRNVALTFPYMHNGAIFDYGPAERGETTADDPTPHLRRVVEFYNRGGGQAPIGVLDQSIHPLHLVPAEIEDIVEFLKSLTDNSLASQPISQMPADLMDVSDCPQ